MARQNTWVRLWTDTQKQYLNTIEEVSHHYKVNVLVVQHLIL